VRGNVDDVALSQTRGDAGRGLRQLPAPARRHREGLHYVVLGTKIVAALLSVSVVFVSAYVWANYRKLDHGLRRLSITTGPQPSVPGGGRETDIDGKDQNLLVIGNDDRSTMTDKEIHQLKTGWDGGSLATDTMIIVHVPADGSKATLISLPRDSYVKIPGYGTDKLNSAYASAYTAAKGNTDAKRAAGANLLIRTITNLTGLTIDHFLQVDLIGFYRISNALGGVPVNLCHAVDDPQYSHLVMSAGKHTISGVQALEFVRQRHGLPHGDIDRTARQRYFLTAAFRKIASAGTLLNSRKLANLVSAVDKSIYVDRTFSLASLIKQMSNLSANNIVGNSIPYEGYANVDVGNVVIVNPAKVKVFVNKLIHAGPPAPSTTPDRSADASPAASPSTTPAAPAPVRTSAKPLDAGCIN
jgi:LCP family protein required for cell wall assembly